MALTPTSTRSRSLSGCFLTTDLIDAGTSTWHPSQMPAKRLVPHGREPL